MTTDRPAGCGCYAGVVCRLCQRVGLPANPDAEPCRCPDLPPADARAFHLGANGIGDAVCGLYAACGLADATGDPIVFHTAHREWLRCVRHPNVYLAGGRAGPDAAKWYETQLRLAAMPGVIADRPTWYADQLAAALKIERFTATRPAEVRRPPPVTGTGYVLLAPFSAWHAREWPAAKWRDLVERLTATGERVIATGGPGDAKKMAAFDALPVAIHCGQPPAWVVSLVANAGRVVGNDSGLAHVAGLLGVPAVAVMTHLRPGFVFGRCAPTVLGVGADPAAWPCQGCAWQREAGYRTDCDRACGALRSVDVERVLASIDQTVLARGEP